MDNTNEQMTKSHSEKEIYEGCLALMDELVKDFSDYLEYIGVDLSDYSEDEQFGVRKTPAEIVERLFLWGTSHSGGTSQRMKCKELGIDDAYEPIWFGFDESREEG